MKKLLLFVCAAITAVSANAQEAVSGKFITAEQARQNVANKVLSTSAVSIAEVAASSNTSAVAAAPALNEIAGNYVEDSFNALHECSSATVTIDRENVKLTVTDGSVVMTGSYDAATGIITFPKQECGVYTDTRGTFTFELYGIGTQQPNGNWSLTEGVAFTVDDEGIISCNQTGYYVRITAFTPAEGSEYTEADMVGAAWTSSWETRFMPVNATQACTANLAQTGYTKYNFPVYVEDYEYSVNVYGFLDLGCVSLDIDDNLNVSISVGQPIRYNYAVKTPEAAAVYGQYYYVTPCDIEGKSLIPNRTKVVPGKLSGNTITISEYFLLRSNDDAEGMGYSYGAVVDGSTITLNEGNFIKGGSGTGIDEIGVTREEKIKNTKTYNIMGQQVNRATAKGLLIRDGKKYIKRN